jgi:cytochrome d ubiquinol oxidase subunit II
MILAIVWFILVFVLLAGYVILDGFDLGVGVLHLWCSGEKERRTSLNAIGPVWDGNEVWLLTGGGALFAAFPAVYATAFSSFYIALMLVLACLIFRATSMEFRSKIHSPRWRGFWDACFGVSSTLLPILLGVAMGNVLRGLPLSADGAYGGSFLGLLNPYAVLIGLLSLVACTMHGAAYLACKTEAEAQARYAKLSRVFWIGAAALSVVATVATAWGTSALPGFTQANPLAWLFLAMLIGTAAAFPVISRQGKYGLAVCISGAMIGSLMGLAATGLFPRLLPSSTHPDASLTIYNSASSQRTLAAMLAIALIGMPLVIGYTFFIYRAFRGPVVLHEDSY